MKIKIIAAIAVFLLFVFSVLTIFFEDTVTPCFMYHSVSDEALFDKAYPELSVKPGDFEKQIKYIAENGYKTLFADEFERDENNIIITFDDGYEDNYYNVFPVLKKYNVKATIFMIAENIGNEGFLTAKQIKEMSESGLVSFGSHGYSHVDLTKISDTQSDTELFMPKKILKEITGKEVKAISYPYGFANEKIRKKASKYYDYQYTTASFKDNKKLSNIHRIGVYRSQSFSDFENLVSERRVYMLKRYIKKFFGKPIPWEEY